MQTTRVIRGALRAVVGTVALLTLAASAAGQEAPPHRLRLEEVVDLALKNYPAIRAAEAQTAATRGGVSLAHTAYLPRIDLLWQENRATRNNVAGLLLPQSVISSISGPVAATAYNGVWGSATGALFSWEPFDFGLRRANVSVAENLVNQAAAGADLTRFQVAARAADAFLAAVEADELVRAAQANVDRLNVFATSVATLVQNQLRPGADASRADAELAAGRIQLLRVQLAATSARATLAELIGLAGQNLIPDAGTLLQKTPLVPQVPETLEAHPAARTQEAAVATVQAREAALSHAYVPRANVQSSWFARGAVPSTLGGSGTDGLWPTTSNWAVGLTFTFPVFDVSNVRARRAIEVGAEAAERARYDQTLEALRAQRDRTTAAFDTARQILEVIPTEVRAAHDAESRARVRYEAGLGQLTEVADAQRLLAQAEVDEAESRLAVWQALLAAASAGGTLEPFLTQIR
jgi:outer membrane protein